MLWTAARISDPPSRNVCGIVGQNPAGAGIFDEMVARIAGETVYLWRAVDHEGEVLDILVQRGRDKAAALKLMRKLLKSRASHRPSSSRTGCDRMQRRSRSFVRRRTATKASGRTTGRKFRTSRSADASERCSGSSQQDLLSASSSPRMPPSTTRSMFNAI